MNKEKILESNKDLLKSLSLREIREILINDNIAITKIDALWNVSVGSFDDSENPYYSITGTDLSYMLMKMFKENNFNSPSAHINNQTPKP